MIPAEVLARLAVRASTLEERLVTPTTISLRNDEALVEARMSRWADLGAKGDRERLKRSLGWRGIELNRVRSALGDASLLPQTKLPSWVLRFATLLEAALAGQNRDDAGPEPLHERAAVVLPFVRAAAIELRQSLPAYVRAGVADSALTSLEKSLSLRMMRIAGPVLDREFYLYAYADSREGGEPGTRSGRFAQRMLDSSFPQFLAEYPVLARLLTLACDNWQVAALELLTRSADDRKDIADLFNAGCDPGKLVDIQVGDADVHDGHREVVILLFEKGFRIVYKPRSLGLDQALHGFIEWLNGHGLSPSLRTPTVLCRHGYGWAEFIEHRLARCQQELALFYRRAGALACVAYMMGATDLHHGNLIAHGSYPIVVDLETFLRANPRSGSLPPSATDTPIPDLQQSRSVVHSLLLPLIHRSPTGIFADLSALGAEPEDDVAEENANWLPVHRTSLRQVLRDHASAIENGFTSTYHLMERHREVLLSDAGPLTAFKGCPIRIVLRDTAIYFQMLRHSIAPAVLGDGIDRGISLERLHHVIAINDTSPSFTDIVTREQTALCGLDIPRFMVMTDETDLRDTAGLVAARVMERTPIEEMRLRITELSESDRERQCNDIRWALDSHMARLPGSRRLNLSPADPARPLDSGKLIASAKRLGVDLLDEANRSAAPPSWRGLIFINAAGRYTLGDAGASFADGGLGVAAFFAALFRVTCDSKWREAALELSFRHLTTSGNSTLHHGHIAGGITTGLGGLLHGTALIAVLLESREMLESGMDLAHRLVGRAIEEEKDLSLGDGLAGTLLGLSSLYQLTADASLKNIAERGAARLRTAKPLEKAGLLSGQAGVMLAASAIGLGKTFSAANLPSSGEALDWAQGCIGISLAALKIGIDNGQSRIFFEKLASAPIASDDSFAFGTAGEVDALLWAADRLKQPELYDLALQRMAEAAERACSGRPRLLGGVLSDSLRMPGLLHGWAGIGYVLLRLASPDRLPSLAAFDMPNTGRLSDARAC